MESSRDRWFYMRTSLEKLGLPFELVDAVVGARLSDAEIAQVYSKKKNFFCYSRYLSKGEIGCYLSHKKAWEQILSENLDFAIVLEDDVEVSPKLVDFISKLNDIPEEFDFIKLISPGRKKRVIKRTKFFDYEIVKWLKPPTYAAAQLITKKGASKLLQTREKFFRPVDVDIQYFWENGLNIVGVYPELASFAKSSEDSTISQAGRKTAKATFPFCRTCNEIYYYINAFVRKILFKQF